MAGINVKDYGAVGDGAINDTAALQAALNAAKTEGPVCYLPAGHYRVEDSLVVPPGVTFCGASGGVPHSEQSCWHTVVAVKPMGIHKSHSSPMQ